MKIEVEVDEIEELFRFIKGCLEEKNHRWSRAFEEKEAEIKALKAGREGEGEVEG